MSFERYEQPDPISLLNERTHGDGSVVNQSDGKPEPLVLQFPLSSLSASLSFPSPPSLARILFYSDFLCVSRTFYRAFISTPLDS